MPPKIVVPPPTATEEFFASLPYWFVFPLMVVLVAGFIAWGTLSGGRRMKVEDDLTGMIVFCFLMAVLGFLFHGMFYRLDAVSYTEKRRAIFDGLAVPREERRHRTGFQSPWDSYQFGLGTGLILMSMLMFGVCMPAMQQTGPVVPAIVGSAFVLLWVALFAIESYDPSVPSEERDVQREEATVEESERALATYCKMDGCRCWYDRPYRKHCSMCNKCTTGFDHHCPFLNQCICDANYKLFFTILVLVNLVCLLAIGCGIWLITEAWQDPDHSAVAKEAKRIWGTQMFSLLAVTMILLALGHLPFVLPLLNYHIYLCRLQRETGLFQATYMFTTDRDGYLRGRGAYLDQRAKDHLMWLTKFLFMDLQAGFEIWSEHVRHKTHLRDSQSVVDGLSSLTKGAIETSSTSSFNLRRGTDGTTSWYKRGLVDQGTGREDTEVGIPKGIADAAEQGRLLSSERQPLLPGPGAGQKPKKGFCSCFNG